MHCPPSVLGGWVVLEVVGEVCQALRFDGAVWLVEDVEFGQFDGPRR